MGSMFGGKGSDEATTTTVQSNPYSEAAAQLAQEYWSETDPLRQSLFSQYSDFLGGKPVSEMAAYAPTYAAAKTGLEDQYALAKQNVMGSTPAGGALTSALANVEAGRASDVGSLPATISASLTQDLMDKIYGTSTGSAATSTSALGTAGNAYASQYASALGAQTSANQMENQSMMGLGQGLGTLGAAAMMGGMCCFIFVESQGGMLHPVVRAYRDQHMTERNRRGYYWLSEQIVPLMRKHKIVYDTVKYLMVEPMVKYGKWFYGLDRKGWIFSPVKSFWLGVFNLLGRRPPYRRKGGEVV